MARPSIDYGVLPPGPTRKPATISRTKSILLLAFVLLLGGFVGPRLSTSLQGTDFPDFYCAARLLAEGHGQELYDGEVQRECQARYAGRVGTLYIHPPFEALLYLAVGWLPLRLAYLLWSVVNVALLGAVCRLGTQTVPSRDWRVLLAASLVFVPVLLCLAQGQDSVLLLWLVVLTWTDLRRGRAFAAGCWLGLGLFKFQLVLPLALALLASQGRSGRGGLARGFSLIALVLAGLSIAICGWPVLAGYPTFLVHLGSQPFAGIDPHAMANFRGLSSILFHGQPAWAIGTVCILCTAGLIMALRDWRDVKSAFGAKPASEAREEFDRVFARTVVLALLVSYHQNPHDLTVLLLPVFVLSRMVARAAPRLGLANWVTAGLLGVLFLPPLHLWLLSSGAYALVSIPLLGLFLSSARAVR